MGRGLDNGAVRAVAALFVAAGLTVGVDRKDAEVCGGKETVCFGRQS